LEVEVYDFSEGWRYVDADIRRVYVSTPDFHPSVKIVDFLKRSVKSLLEAPTLP